MPNKKQCNKCNQWLSTDNFHKASRNRDGLYHTCKSCRKKIDRYYYLASDKKNKHQERIEHIARWLKEYKKSLHCMLCGENEACCLDFHHLKQKDFTISQWRVYASNIDKIKDEIKKCVVLCSNCHRKLHEGLIKL